MLSNYPPGVSGFEFEIAGPDYEVEDIVQCPRCGEDVEVIVCGYENESWYEGDCAFCGNNWEWSGYADDGRDFEGYAEYAERYAEAMAERIEW